MKPSASRPKARRPYQKHGLVRLKAALSELGTRGLDGRTRLARAVSAQRRELVEDLGELSPRQEGLVDVAVMLRLLIDSGSTWALAQHTLVNGRRRAFYPIVGELASLLTRYQAVMKDLGLERRPRPALSLRERLELRAAERAAQVPSVTPAGAGKVEEASS